MKKEITDLDNNYRPSTVLFFMSGMERGSKWNEKHNFHQHQVQLCCGPAQGGWAAAHPHDEEEVWWKLETRFQPTTQPSAGLSMLSGVCQRARSLFGLLLRKPLMSWKLFVCQRVSLTDN